MPAQNKVELTNVTEREFKKLRALLDGLDPDIALAKDAQDTSIKDVVAHRAHWIDLFLGWFADGRAGKEVHFPAPGYKWNELKRYNADLRAAQKDLSWNNACGMLDQEYQELRSLIEILDDAELYGAPMQGAKNAWTTGRWAEAAGPSHFRSAAKYIQAQLRARC